MFAWFRLPSRILAAVEFLIQVNQRLERKVDAMANANQQQADAILAKVTQQTDALKAVQTAVVGLTEGKATIQEEIQALKDQITSAGVSVDLGPLEAAVANHGAVIDGLATAIPAGTGFDPSANRS